MQANTINTILIEWIFKKILNIIETNKQEGLEKRHRKYIPERYLETDTIQQRSRINNSKYINSKKDN